eukprot:5162352-Amphidinium_carterae.1
MCVSCTAKKSKLCLEHVLENYELPLQNIQSRQLIIWSTQPDLHLPQRPFVPPPEIVFNSDPFTIEEVSEAINELKKNKSPGPDSLTAEILQILPQIVIERFTSQ